MGVGAEIRAEMARQSVTGVALARVTGLKRPYLSQRLNEHADLRVNELRQIGAVLGIPASEFIRRAEQAEARDAVALNAEGVPALADVDDSLALADGPSLGELEAHVDACDACTSAEDALEHARLSEREAA